MRRRHQRVSLDIVVGVAQDTRHVEDEGGENHQVDDDREAVLHRVVRVEGQSVLLRVLDFQTGRIAIARHVQRPDVQADNAGNHEGQQVVQGEEAVQRGLTNGEATPQPFPDRIADEGQRADQVGDHHGAPVGHLAPRQHIAHEGRGHHQQVDHDTEDPEYLPRCLVGPVIQAPEHMQVDGDEEEARAIGVAWTG